MRREREFKSVRAAMRYVRHLPRSWYVGISSRRVPMVELWDDPLAVVNLEYFRPQYWSLFKENVELVLGLMAMEFSLYTPRGVLMNLTRKSIHMVVGVSMRHPDFMAFYKALYQACRRYKRCVIDLAYLKWVIDTGYATLRVSEKRDVRAPPPRRLLWIDFESCRWVSDVPVLGREVMRVMGWCYAP